MTQTTLLWITKTIEMSVKIKHTIFFSKNVSLIFYCYRAKFCYLVNINIMQRVKGGLNFNLSMKNAFSNLDFHLGYFFLLAFHFSPMESRTLENKDLIFGDEN